MGSWESGRWLWSGMGSGLLGGNAWLAMQSVLVLVARRGKACPGDVVEQN